MATVNDVGIGQTWIMWLMQAGLAILLALFGFIWRQVEGVRRDGRTEAQKLRDDLEAATRKQDLVLQTTVERIRIDMAMQNNITREERKEMKTELRQDNLETKDEIRSDMAQMENRIMRALDTLGRQRV